MLPVGGAGHARLVFWIFLALLSPILISYFFTGGLGLQVQRMLRRPDQSY